MSAIAHWIEQQGINTVVIGLVRLHLEKIKPPRALFVPFELGRPLGPPSDRDFQKRVLTQALTMVETHSSHAIEDFAEDDPRATDNPDWLPPEIPACTSVADECAALKPFFQRQCVSNSRTAVGVSGISIVDAAALLDEVIGGKTPPQPLDDKSPLATLRFAIDDLKAYYIETALANGKPSSLQIHNWFWFDTLLGPKIRELRVRYMDDENSKMVTLGEKFFVPHQWRV